MPVLWHCQLHLTEVKCLRIFGSEGWASTEKKASEVIVSFKQFAAFHSPRARTTKQNKKIRTGK